MIVPAHYTGVPPWLDSVSATQSGGTLFKQALTYDSSGQILTQRYQHGVSSESIHKHYYDNVDRLTGWWIDGAPDTTKYWYDAVGNRTRGTLSWREGFYTYGDAGGVGPNRLMSHLDSNAVGHMPNKLTTNSYDADGAMTGRTIVDYGYLTTTGEEYVYSYRNLVRRYRSGPGGGIASVDWRYRSSANGEREQKRMYWQALDTLGSGIRHPWVYYLLGASKEQLSVWHGVETCDTLCGSTGERVYMYPKWYLTPGVGWNGVREDLAPVITHADGTLEYRVSDHLASLRWRQIGVTTTETYDYTPWGSVHAGGPAGASERTFNENERDVESGQYDLGVRRYEDETGRFGSVDPLWEGDHARSPYAYAGLNPINATDPDGRQVRAIFREPAVKFGPVDIDLTGVAGSAGLTAAVTLRVIGALSDGGHDARVYAPAVPAMGATLITQGYAQGLMSSPSIVESRNNTFKDQIEGHVNNVNVHLRRLEGLDDSHGSPNDPQNRWDWKKDIQRAIGNIRNRLKKLGKSLDQVLKERGWSQQDVDRIRDRLVDQGIDNLPK